MQFNRGLALKTWNTYNDWENNTDKYLSKFADNWDWKVLSKTTMLLQFIYHNRNTKAKNGIGSTFEFGGFLTKPDKRQKKIFSRKVVKQFHTT